MYGDGTAIPPLGLWGLGLWVERLSGTECVVRLGRSISLSVLLCNPGLVVVDRTLGPCPFTCSSRRLTSHLSYLYISTTQSLRPQCLALIFILVYSRSVQVTSMGFYDKERVADILSIYTSRLRPRLSFSLSLSIYIYIYMYIQYIYCIYIYTIHIQYILYIYIYILVYSWKKYFEQNIPSTYALAIFCLSIISPAKYRKKYRKQQISNNKLCKQLITLKHT